MTKYEILKNIYGYDKFRDGQEELIDAAFDRKDVLGIMPTGAGKSVCFQIPALMFEGITIVVSPLISLMKDQVASLNQVGVHAAYINSSLSERQVYMAMENARKGQYKIIYVAPERLMTGYFQSLIGEVDISMLVVDEAHCISQWGQDFRPSYLKINDFIELLPVRPVIAAYTATATIQVRQDILRILNLNAPKVVVTGYDRANLYFAVRKPSDKFQELLKIMKEENHTDENEDSKNVNMKSDSCGIIYCNTRKNVDEVYERLFLEGYPVAKYHAGMSDSDRHDNQEDFIYDRKTIMVATNAFGMGIDKSNVRFVVHYNMPKDLESYYQEAGRAGRDGAPSKCILLYSGQDVVINEFLISKQHENEELSDEDRYLLEQRDKERLRKMTFYCVTSECLRDYILKYFGEKGKGYCGNCENCLTEYEQEDMTLEAIKLIGFISSTGERFGMTNILSAFHGAANEKIYKFGLDENMYFGAAKNIPMSKLRMLANELLLKDYIFQAGEKYPIVKVSEKGYDLFEKRNHIMETEQIILKLPKNRQDEGRAAKRKGNASSRRKGVSNLDADAIANQELFDALKKLRMEISKEIKMPPYIIFTDVALKEMSRYMPVTREEMLDIKGVGEFKYEKYGERFIRVIKQYK